MVSIRLTDKEAKILAALIKVALDDFDAIKNHVRVSREKNEALALIYKKLGGNGFETFDLTT